MHMYAPSTLHNHMRARFKTTTHTCTHTHRNMYCTQTHINMQHATCNMQHATCNMHAYTNTLANTYICMFTSAFMCPQRFTYVNTHTYTCILQTYISGRGTDAKSSYTSCCKTCILVCMYVCMCMLVSTLICKQFRTLAATWYRACILIYACMLDGT